MASDLYMFSNDFFPLNESLSIIIHNALFACQESVNMVFFIWLIGLMTLMMFQEPYAELFDRSRAIIHWKIPHAVLVRIIFQTLIVPHLLALFLS